MNATRTNREQLLDAIHTFKVSYIIDKIHLTFEMIYADDEDEARRLFSGNKPHTKIQSVTLVN